MISALLCCLKKAWWWDGPEKNVEMLATDVHDLILFRLQGFLKTYNKNKKNIMKKTNYY